MKVVFNNIENAYIAEFEYYEMKTLLNTNDIVEARKYFIEHMTTMFNNAVKEQLKDSF